jgi:MYXO-CTERM domain-containing protein
VAVGFAGLATVSAACARTSGPQFTLTRRPIINGTVDAAHPSVVALLYQGEQFCTGTVIAPRAILSAGHCQAEMAKLPGFVASACTVYFGTTVGGGGRDVAVETAHLHPQYALRDDGAPLNDLSVWTLAEDAPAPAVAWQQTLLGAITGEQLTLVGYGVTDAAQQSGAGTRRVVTDSVTDEDDLYIYYGTGGGGTCQGDSGGPLLVNRGGVETLVGVCSFGDVSYLQGAGTRVDTHAAFIRQYAATGTGGDGCSTGDPRRASGALALVVIVLAAVRRRRSRGVSAGAPVSSFRSASR